MTPLDRNPLTSMAVPEEYQKLVAMQRPQIRRRLHRWFCMPDNEPPTPKQHRELRWFYEEGFLRPHEVKIMRQALREERNLQRWQRVLDWMARMKHLRTRTSHTEDENSDDLFS